MRSKPTSAWARRRASWRSPQAVLYLACAAKSNAAYVAYGKARAFIAEDGSRPVPLHFRNAPTRLMKDLGYGKGYRYAHDEEDAYAAGERYLPEGMPEISFYAPTERGLEAKIAEKLAALRERDAQDARRRQVLTGRDRRGTGATRSSGAFARIDACLTFNCFATISPALPRACSSAVTFSTQDKFERVEAERKAIQTRTQELQAKRNALSKQVGAAKGRGEDAAEADGRGAHASATSSTRWSASSPTSRQGLREWLLGMPNLPHASVPVGHSEADNVEVRRWGTPRAFAFAPRDHVDVGAAVGGLDFEASAKLAGARFYTLRGAVARLHRALASSCSTCIPPSTAIPSATCPTSSTRRR